ncbi:hypothetical protein HYH03_002948 [Edaphochlamys debaryana]|uniref:Endoglucanase n=1 Tax=Edaphochlamys debaryana TaxID=47281 RepID=A0A835YDQ3_9CHLO|nr:hypothetical protein HYH03_002948 [Edaphochlamys debaryana]|eukprot:KAG2499373.1 hypothetical protein HYH03_002948 [Edaphochlamys debaryana]
MGLWALLAALVVISDVQPAAAQHNFAALMSSSFRFYEAQMSGDLPSWCRASQANGGWRNRSHLLDGTGPDGINRDLSGGWYDAGDHLKLHLPLGSAASLLAYGALTWESLYRTAGEWDVAVRNVAWVAAYMAKAHYQASDTPSANAFVAQVGDPGIDHSTWWGRPEQQAQQGAPSTPGWRPVHTITAATGKGADILAEAAATLAGASLLLRRPGAHSDPALAAAHLRRARQLFEFAKLLPNPWSPPSGEVPYPSSSTADDMAWAGAWLCRADVDAGVAPGASPACAAALPFWNSARYLTDRELSWNQMGAPAALLLRDSGAGSAADVAAFESYLSTFTSRWIDSRGTSCASTGGGGLCYTPGGLAWLTEWGSLRHAANAALVALASSRPDGGAGAALTPAARVVRQCWARSQVSYMLGDNTQNQSYVVGYRPTPQHKSPGRPHHRSASCDPAYAVSCSWAQLDAPGPNPSTLAGALVGGPGPDDSYVDDRRDYKKNEVAVDYNAGFTGALAALASLERGITAGGCTWASPAPTDCAPSDYACLECAKPQVAAPAACRTCVARLRTAGLDPWKCLACAAAPITDAGVQGVCMNECVPGAAPKGTDWACPQPCAAPSLVGTDLTRARECSACVVGAGAADTWGCNNCFQVTAAMPDAASARSTCLSCVGSAGIGAWACGECAKLSTPAARAACVSCVQASPGNAWGCAHPSRRQLRSAAAEWLRAAATV